MDRTKLTFIVALILTGSKGDVWYDLNQKYDFSSGRQEDCGLVKIDSRGNVNWPWIAQIFKRNDDESKYLCAGTLITSRHLVTSAVCMTIGEHINSDVNTLEVIVGSSIIGRGRIRRVESYKIHPNFRILKIYNDVAVLKLAKHLFQATPICLPFKWRHLENHRLFSIGWGTDQYGEVINPQLTINRKIVLPNSQCQHQPRAFYHQRGIPDYLICTIVESEFLQSDDGSPEMLYQDRRWILIGITNWKSSLDDRTPFSTSIFHFMDWLFEVID